METIAAAHSFLDRQESLAIWQAAYHELEESIVYANPFFCETFGLTLDDVLERRRYHLVNPPDTTTETIAQYKAEDRQAMEDGYFLQRSPVGDDRDIVVLKLRFDQGILGMFKFIDSDLPGPLNDPNDLDADFRAVVEMVKNYPSGKSC